MKPLKFRGTSRKYNEHLNAGQRPSTVCVAFSRGPALRRMALCSVSSKSDSHQRCKQGCSNRRWSSGQRLQERMPQPSGLWAGRAWIQQCALLLPLRDQWVGLMQAPICKSTHVQAPTAEPERLLALVQSPAHADSVTSQLLMTSIPTMNAAVQAREAAANAAEQQAWVHVGVLRNHRGEECVELLRLFAVKYKTWSPWEQDFALFIGQRYIPLRCCAGACYPLLYNNIVLSGVWHHYVPR
eukprot:1141948-Pelagomonas_calceolata.AAC.2